MMLDYCPLDILRTRLKLADMAPNASKTYRNDTSFEISAAD